MIYFITDGKNIKIGKSNNPRKRLLDLQTANANALKLKYIFDIPDRFEKHLHEKLKKFKTDSRNEWFNFEDGYLEIRLLRIDPVFLDLPRASQEAERINNSIYKDSGNTKIKKTGVKLGKGKINLLLSDIRKDLSKKNKRISYRPYIIKYNFTSNEISFYVKSANLSKAVYLHNSKLG